MGSAAAPPGYGDMGGASFTLAIDQGNFEPALAQAEGAAKRFRKNVTSDMQAIGASVRTSTHMAGSGLLQLSYAVDDIQYGFRSVVNNIPQLVMGLGGPEMAGIAGAAGIAAVAVNLLINNWDKLSASLFGTKDDLPKLSKDLGELAIQLKEMATQAEALMSKNLKEGFNLFDQEKLAKLKGLMKDAKDTLAVEKAIDEHSIPKSEKENATAFGKALEELPEGATTVVKMLMDKMSPQDAQKIVAQAILGKQWAMEDIAKAIPAGATGFALNQALPKVREAEAAKKKETEDNLKMTKEFEAGKKEKDKLALDKEVAKKEAEMDQIRHKQQILRGLAGEKNQSQTFGGTAAFAGAMMTNALNDPAKQQLKEAVKLNGQIEKLREDIKRMNNVARFGG